MTGLMRKWPIQIMADKIQFSHPVDMKQGISVNLGMRL